MHGFLRLAAAIPDVRVADVNHNVEQIVALTRMAADEDVALAVFPELSITGYTCADLFFQSRLTDTAVEVLERIAQETKSCDTIIVVGAPLYHRNRLYNCGIVIQSGQVRGVVPKSFLPNYKEFYEKRWFTPGADVFDRRGGIERAPLDGDVRHLALDDQGTVGNGQGERRAGADLRRAQGHVPISLPRCEGARWQHAPG